LPGSPIRRGLPGTRSGNPTARTRLYYCTVSPGLAEDLEVLLRSHPIKEVLWHIKGFGDRRLLFAIHDADLGDSVFLSGDIESRIVRAVGAAIGRKPAKTQTHYDWEENHQPKGGSRTSGGNNR